MNETPGIRPSRASKWRAAVLVGVHVAIAVHIAHWLSTGRTVTPVEPSEAMAFARGGVVNAGLIFFAATILLTALFGRFFCGWGCHLVALQDLCRWLLEKVGLRPVPLRSRWLMWVPALAFVYMFLWPVAYRLWIRDSFRHVEMELTTTAFWATFPGWVIGGITFLLCGFVAVYFLGAKGFCTYACPYGAAFGMAEKVAPMRIRVTDACEGCGHCTAVCTSNVRVHEEVRDFRMVVDAGCMKCLDCVSVCPNDALYYGFGPLPFGRRKGGSVAEGQRWPLKRWEEAFLAVAFAAAFFTFRGLYGYVPFLMSLGLAAILAYGLLQLAWIWNRPNLSFRRIALTRGGELQTGGKVFLGVATLVLVFWAHSALIRAHQALGQRAYLETAGIRHAVLDPTRALELRRVPEVERAWAHLSFADRFGLFDTLGNASRLAWLHFLRGDLPGASAQARAAIEKGEEPSTMYRLLARLAVHAGDLPSALDSLQRAIAADPRDLSPRLALGMLLAEQGDLEAAAEAFLAGLRLAENPRLVYNLALVRALQGNPEVAIALFERALVLDPTDQAARENLAGSLASVGRFEESISQYRQALERKPEDSETRLLLARVLIAAGRSGEADSELRGILSRNPESPEAQRMLEELTPPQRR
ncbi:MAG: tetratricopeptide repeat protein [Acidobacteria bacterium]|nr:tetratricopeptide repeat protein [Acidobacteriota bacterium]